MSTAAPYTAERIRSIAQAARVAFEASPLVRLDDGLWFDDFPHGCCGDACLLLAEVYRAAGLSTVCVYGERDGGRSHVWLVVGGLTVDVTADQFDGESMPPCFVAGVSPWHATWARCSGQQSLYEYADDDRWRTWLGQALDELRRRMAAPA